MEYPGEWDLLTASLAVSNLALVDEAWAFLTKHRLVRNLPGDREAFLEVVRYEVGKGPITGPSVARRVASQLGAIGIALPEGEAPDPWGKIAQERLKRTS
jgi:hypothetical protein